MTRRTLSVGSLWSVAVGLTLLAPAVGAQVPTSDRSRDAGLDGPEAQVFLNALQAVHRMHMEAFSDSALWTAALDGMIKGLHDPYAAVFTPREAAAFEEETTGNYAGIGVQITPLNDRITITAVFRGTPAEQIGLQVGDHIVGVDGDDARDWTTDSAAVRIRGPAGSQVEVLIERQGLDEPVPYTITRGEVHIPAVNYGLLDNGVAYVLLDRVARNAASEMDSALRRLSGARGLIIDLRRNPGGYLDESLMLADIFLQPGSTLARTVQRKPGEPADSVARESYTDRWPARVPDLPIVVLVDRFTASGAEILAGALQDYDRAVVLGERSFGKGLVQTVLRMPFGRRLRFTTGTWQTPLGRSLHRPRDLQGRPLPENLDTLPRVRTAHGRELLNGGGIFPDLPLPNDTLKLAERAFLNAANAAKAPVGRRIAEYAFEEAQARRVRGGAAGVEPARFQALLERLRQDGLPRETLADSVVDAYLNWRVRLAVAQRMDDVGREAEFRRERDPVLDEAVRLLGDAPTQADLFAAVQRARDAMETRGQAGGP